MFFKTKRCPGDAAKSVPNALGLLGVPILPRDFKAEQIKELQAHLAVLCNYLGVVILHHEGYEAHELPNAAEQKKEGLSKIKKQKSAKAS